MTSHHVRSTGGHAGMSSQSGGELRPGARMPEGRREDIDMTPQPLGSYVEKIR